MSQGHIMPKNFTTPQSIAALYNSALAQGSAAAQTSAAAAQAQQASTQYNYTLLQNAYNPYAQSGYLGSMRQVLQDWQLQKEYFVNGEWMSMEEFVNFLYPEDCAERTFLILKLTGNKKEDDK